MECNSTSFTNSYFTIYAHLTDIGAGNDQLTSITLKIAKSAESKAFGPAINIKNCDPCLTGIEYLPNDINKKICKFRIYPDIFKMLGDNGRQYCGRYWIIMVNRSFGLPWSFKFYMNTPDWWIMNNYTTLNMDDNSWINYARNLRYS